MKSKPKHRIRTDAEERAWIEAFLAFAAQNLPPALAADAADIAANRFVQWRDKPDSEEPTT